MILKLITIKESYELKLEDIKASELLKQIELKRPEQMITLGKGEGAPYLIGIKPLHLVGYELIPEVLEKVLMPAVVSVRETEDLKQQIEIARLKAELEALKNNPESAKKVLKRGRPAKV